MKQKVNYTNLQKAEAGSLSHSSRLFLVGITPILYLNEKTENYTTYIVYIMCVHIIYTMIHRIQVCTCTSGNSRTNMYQPLYYSEALIDSLSDQQIHWINNFFATHSTTSFHFNAFQHFLSLTIFQEAVTLI